MAQDLSIVIVNWNSWDYAKKCLKSLREMFAQNLTYEVILIDNASAENRCMEVELEFQDLYIRVIRNSDNLGFAKACNQGIKMSASQFVLMLNPDTEVKKDAIGKSVEFMKNHPTVGALGCRLLNTDGSLQRWTGGRFPSLSSAFNHYFFLSENSRFQGIYLSHETESPVEVDWVCGAFMLLSRKAIDQVGVFNESFFMYGEDIDLCYRIKNLGWKVVYLSKAEITHHYGKSIEHANQDRYWKGLLSMSVFHELHGGSGFRRVIFDLITAAGFLIRSVLFLIQGIFTVQKKLMQQASISWKFFLGSLRILTAQPSFRTRGITQAVVS